ncbi:hypothetical protein JW977_05035 [Candidatus Falkowbacteria bacterium]|nr:hypothetical protein [Candidatus Falkowbacteria bacterium]
MLVLFIGILTNKLGKQKNNYNRGNLPSFIVTRKYFLRPIAHCFAGG